MVYLLHFDRGFKHARHFVGATTNDLEAHALARGVVPLLNNHLLNAARQQGIAFTVVRTWPGNMADAYRRRQAGNHAKLCALCAREHAEAR